MEIAETAPNSHSRTSQCYFLQVRPLTELDVDRVEPNLANLSIRTLPYAVANPRIWRCNRHPGRMCCFPGEADARPRNRDPP